MKKPQSTVVPIRQEPAEISANLKAVGNSNVIQASAQLLKGYLQVAMTSYIEQIGVLMTKRMDDGDASISASEIRMLQKESDQLSSRYIDLVVKNIVNFSSVVSASREKRNAPKRSDDWTSLQLLDTDEVEKQLMLESYISAGEAGLADILYGLQRRLEFILKSSVQRKSDNPYSPHVLLMTYSELVDSEGISKDVYNTLCEAFSITVLSNLGDVLEKINEAFIQANVLPDLPKSKPITKSGGASARNEAVSPTEASPQAEELEKKLVANEHKAAVPMRPVTEIEPALYRSLVEMAEVFRTQVGENVLSDGLAVSGKSMPTIELIDTLTELQKGSAISGGDLNNSVRLQIGSSVQLDGQRRPYEEQDEILIDVVAMFFDVILQDRHLPDIVRVLIAQLQIPVLKVAMMDKEFFTKKSHHTRRFLNALSQVGLGISEQNKQIKSAVLEKMEELVARVLMDFEDDVEIFSELCDEFEIFMEQQQRQMDVIEARSRKVTQSTEHLELIKRKADYEIALRLEGKCIPEFVQLFLEDAWKDVLVLALLREGKAPGEAEQCLTVIDHLIESVVRPEGPDAKRSIIKGLANLFKGIKLGLEGISYDFHATADFFKDLESWHKQVLMVVSNVQADVSVDEEVALVSFEDTSSSVSLDEELQQELEGELAQMPEDKFSQQVNDMQVGDWVEYENPEETMMRAKLSWKSNVTMQCLFVDASGAKAMDISVADFAEELREKRMWLIGQEKASLVERALSGMKKRIASVGEEPELA